MRIVVLTDSKTGTQMRGILQPPRKEFKAPDTLVAAMGSGSFMQGQIDVNDEVWDALYTIETPASESDRQERQDHQNWMKANNSKPGDAIGMACDKRGKLFRFQTDPSSRLG